MKQIDDIIVDIVNKNARVLDLGCGEGELLQRLAKKKSVTGYGVERSQSRIEACLARGVNVVEHDINSGLDRFPTDSFDMVIMTETIQAIDDPQQLVQEMLRIGEECIVSFPNFAYWQCRNQLFWRGRMPVSSHLPHEWYNTPNIHLCTIQDFDNLCLDENIRVVARYVFNPRGRESLAAKAFRNFFGMTAFYRLARPS